MEWSHKRITLISMWIASLVGAIYGLVFTIIGAGFNWGPGGSLEGPYWKIIVSGLISIIIGMYVGELVVRKLAAIVFKKQRSKPEYITLLAVTCVFGSFLAWVFSWEAGFISSILMDSLSFGDDASWLGIIGDVALMTSIFGLPFYLLAGGMSALFSYFVLRNSD